MAQHRADCGSTKDNEADRGRHRITRKPQQRGGSDVPKCQRFPRFHADLPDRDLALGLQDILYQIVVTERHPARGYDQVNIACLGETTDELRNRVSSDAKQAGLRAPGASKRAEYKRVTVADHPGRQAVTSRRDLVSRGENPNDRSPMDLNARLTNRRNQPEVCRPQLLSTASHAGTTSNVLASITN